MGGGWQGGGIMKKNYIYSDILKAISICFVILMHSLQYKANADYQKIYREFGFDFWVAQAVSVFVIITGFHYAASLEGLSKEETWYRKDIFLKKLLRIIPAFTFIFLLWNVYMLFAGKYKIGIDSLFLYLKGGAGPGGYYTPVVLQFLIIFPVIYYILKKSLIFGSFFVFSLNILYEYMVYNGVIRSSFHRLCGIRLIMGLMFGIIIYRYAGQLRKSVIPHLMFAGGGGIFLLYHNYGGYRTQFISSWICNSFMGMAYSAGIVFFACYHEDLLEQLFEKPVSKKILRFIRYIGKASYHIFLVQQLWFCISFPLRDRIRIRYAYIIDLSICIILGCAFYFIYSLIEGRMGKKVKINPS